VWVVPAGIAEVDTGVAAVEDTAAGVVEVVVVPGMVAAVAPAGSTAA